MKAVIREAQPDDLSALLDLYRHLHSDDGPPIEAKALAKVWDEMLSDRKLRCLVGDFEGELVASCTLIVVPNLTRGARPYGLIENVVTHAGHRRRGFATQLLRRALEMAWDVNCYKVMLLTGSKRPEVHRFYEKAGFVAGDKTGFVARP
jgi:GNAT superfamily N-acetyltransferase